MARLWLNAVFSTVRDGASEPSPGESPGELTGVITGFMGPANTL